MTPTLWDMHVHLDFMQGPVAVAAQAQELGLGMFANTVTPGGYASAQTLLTDAPNVRVSVGLHPWWVADGRCDEDDAQRVAELVRTTRFVGEIGLDLSPRHVPEGSIESQLAAFETIVRACAETSDASAPKVLSIHAVRAAGLALDTLEEAGTLARCACIFHWFSGTSDELHRLVRTGCFVSVNEMMLRTRRGREYARQLPARQLLLETDLPPGEDVPFAAADILASLERTADQLSTIRHEDVRPLTCENSVRLLDC